MYVPASVNGCSARRIADTVAGAQVSLEAGQGEGKGRRGWSVLGKGGEVLSEVRDAWGVAFLDMDEDVSILGMEKGEWND